MFKPTWIVVHTAADPREGGAYDTSAEEIKRWHKARGWSTIGYHKVVRRNGLVESGRPETTIGAHVQGANSVSLGVCLSGHGDLQPPTKPQYNALIRQLARWCRQYNISPNRIIGHREVNRINKNLSTTKTCPGRKVDMDKIRGDVKEFLEKPDV